MQQRRYLYLNAQIRQLEQVAINDYNISISQLMQRAGAAAFNLFKANWPTTSSVTIFCGAGNNAGDGYVFASLAKQAGLAVQCFYLTPVEQLPGAAIEAARDCMQTGVVLTEWQEPHTIDGDVIIDALVGTGLKREISGVWFNAITAINQSVKPVLAIDVPSGLNSDTGSVHGISVKAAITITFIAEKIGLYTGQAADYCGKIMVESLGVPQQAYDALQAIGERNDCPLKNYLPLRARSAHKGNFGHVLIIGGNYGMPGAVSMAARAALRVGAGRVSVATRPLHVYPVMAQQAEIMCYGVETPQDIQSLLKKANIIVIGPGLGCDQWARVLFNEVLKQATPLIIDADALNLLAETPAKSQQWLLTPHPGEAARLLRCDTATIQADRVYAIKKIQEQYNGVCLLKGAGSLVYDGQDTISVCPVASPAMASAGMGDILSGVLAGLVAQGLTLVEAARLGMNLHAKAAVKAAVNGERGVLATDLLPPLYNLVNEYA